MSPVHWSREAFLLPLFCLVFVACSDDPVDPEPDPVAAEIRFSVDDSLGLYAGESGALGAAAYDADGSVIADAPINWITSNPGVVSVDSAGVLTALEQGLATVTATFDTLSATVTVRVTDFVQISTKIDPLCALDVEGRVWCVGTERRNVSMPVDPVVHETWEPVPGDFLFSEITSGYRHACGLVGAAAYCWGMNDEFQLGNNDVLVWTAEPVVVDGGAFVAVDGGGSHTCALDPAGDAYCWGRGFEGQLGHGVFGLTVVPSLVLGDHSWRTIDAGYDVTCGVAEDGVTYCWGDLIGHNLVAVPTAVAGVPADLELVRADEAACGSKGAAVYCWGDGTPEPVQATMPGDVIDLVLGEESVCALLASGDVYCWGSNARGLLGDASVASAAAPIPIAGDRKFVGITGEWTRHCGHAEDGGVYCWGTTISAWAEPSSEPVRFPAPMP